MRNALLCTLVVIAFTACNANTGVREDLQHSAEQYNESLRAQEFNKTSLFVSETFAEEFNARLKAVKNIKVVECRIVNIKYEEAKGEAEVKVEIDYYPLSTYRLKTLLDVQKWAYVTENGAKQKQWRLKSLLPEFP